MSKCASGNGTYTRYCLIRNRDTGKRYALPIQVSELARKLYALMGVKWSGTNLTSN